MLALFLFSRSPQRQRRRGWEGQARQRPRPVPSAQKQKQREQGLGPQVGGSRLGRGPTGGLPGPCPSLATVPSGAAGASRLEPSGSAGTARTPAPSSSGGRALPLPAICVSDSTLPCGLGRGSLYHPLFRTSLWTLRGASLLPAGNSDCPQPCLPTVSPRPKLPIASLGSCQSCRPLAEGDAVPTGSERQKRPVILGLKDDYAEKWTVCLFGCPPDPSPRSSPRRPWEATGRRQQAWPLDGWMASGRSTDSLLPWGP